MLNCMPESFSKRRSGLFVSVAQLNVIPLLKRLSEKILSFVNLVPFGGRGVATKCAHKRCKRVSKCFSKKNWATGWGKSVIATASVSGDFNGGLNVDFD